MSEIAQLVADLTNSSENADPVRIMNYRELNLLIKGFFMNQDSDNTKYQERGFIP